MEEKIAEMQAQIKSLQEDVLREKIKASAYGMGLDMGAQVTGILRGLVDSGLNEDLAEEIVLIAIKRGAADAL